METGEIGEVELRRYPVIRVVTVAGNNESGGFRILFRYLTGNNRPRMKIPVTAPVLSDATIMSFVMPAGFTREDLPEPRDARLSLREILSREVAVIRFRGRAGAQDVADVRARLLSALAAEGIPTIGEPSLMRYNAPFTPGFLRRNEVGMEIRRE